MFECKKSGGTEQTHCHGTEQTDSVYYQVGNIVNSCYFEFSIQKIEFQHKIKMIWTLFKVFNRYFEKRKK